MQQLNLFENVVNAYANATRLSNNQLYEKMTQLGVTFGDKTIVGKQPIDAVKRRIRWIQQTLKHAGILTRVSRGFWELNVEKKNDLTLLSGGYAVLGFSTTLGIAVIAKSESFFNNFNEPIHLILTSPPYPLNNPRKYGNVKESEYVDWFCKTIEPVIKCMAPGASFCLNISNDIFLSRLPARSLYRERLVIALCERFDLYKCDELIWENRSKPPAPIAWASKKRVQLNVAWEPVYWFTNDPEKLQSDNRRVLEPHSLSHLKLIEQGGIQTGAINSDGAYRKRAGSFGNYTSGKIPKNVLSVGHACASARAYKKYCLDAGIPVHGAMMPLRLTKFLIEFMTREDDLVADPFAGAFTTCLAAEQLKRRWIGVEQALEYVQGAKLRFLS